MVRKQSNEFVRPAFSYGAVEKALGAVFDANAKTQQGALRGRLKHLQRLGLPGTVAGKGTRIQYSAEQACQWLLALLMSDAGIDPKVSVKLIHKFWAKYLKSIVLKATDHEAMFGYAPLPANPVFLTLRPRLMSGDWSKQKLDVHLIGFFRRFDYHLKGPDGRPIQRELISNYLNDLETDWLCVRNLTRALSTFFDNLHYEA
jgi:hypothetical protein